jgi:hypothetical protein
MYNQYDIQIMFAMRAWINEGETLAVDVLGPNISWYNLYAFLRRRLGSSSTAAQHSLSPSHTAIASQSEPRTDCCSR